MVHFFYLVSNNPPLTIKFDHPTQGEVYEVGVDKPIVWDVYKGNEPAPDYELAKINSFNIFCDPDGKGYKVYIAKPVLKADVTASDKYAYNWKPCVTGNSVKIKIEGITNGQPGRIIAKGESSAFKVQIGAVSITPGFNFGNDPGFSWHNIKSRIDILNGLFKASPPFDELIQAETVQTLENGNYFNLKTMDDKRNFLNSNITDSSIRNAIINIESNNNWNINTTNVPELSNGSSVDYSDSMIDLAAQYANKLDWYNKKARINCPNNQKPFLEKTCWDGNGLNFIYSNYFSYLAEENKSKIKFDDEITLLERMYNETAGFNLIQQDPINDTDQGTINAYKLFFGDSPIWLAALSFVPAERLLLPVARAGQLLCRVGDGVAKGLTLGLKRKTNRIALLLHEINLPSLGTFNININEIARHSWLSAKTIKGIVNDYAIILDDWVGDDLFSRWMTKEEAIIALKDNTFIDGWRQFNLFINDKYMCFKASGYCTWSGSIHIHDTIYGMIDSAGTYRHEMGHYISNPIDEVDGWLHYSKPLNEGHTEFLTQQLAKRTGKPVSWLSKSYGKEVSLTQDIFYTLQAKNRALGLPSATDDILQIMGDGYFRDGIDVYLDYQLDPYTPDASSVFGTIVNFTDAGDYRGASNYLKSIRTYMNW